MFGFFMSVDSGRTVPKLVIFPEVKGCKLAALGWLGYAVSTAQAVGSDGAGLMAPVRVKQSVALMLAVRKFVPSKIRSEERRVGKEC